ncbi:MAG: hypothetical protein ABW173_10585 [Sphingomonas sp.]
MSATGDEKTPPASPPDAGRQPADPAIKPPVEPEADHGAGGDPLIEGP